jgi:hypothetical protein
MSALPKLRWELRITIIRLGMAVLCHVGEDWVGGKLEQVSGTRRQNPLVERNHVDWPERKLILIGGNDVIAPMLW